MKEVKGVKEARKEERHKELRSAPFLVALKIKRSVLHPLAGAHLGICELKHVQKAQVFHLSIGECLRVVIEGRAVSLARHVAVHRGLSKYGLEGVVACDGLRVHACSLGLPPHLQS